MRRLLTHLAQFSSFAKQGELLCTQSVAHFIQDREARTAFNRYVCGLLNSPSLGEFAWRAEVRQADSGRPDLEGCTADRGWLVKIEAKLGTELHPSQLQSYLSDLETLPRRVAAGVDAPSQNSRCS